MPYLLSQLIYSRFNILFQDAFAEPSRSIVKTGVMMIGEFEFDNIFNDGNKPVPGVTWFIFIIFLIVMTLILMNLLVRHLIVNGKSKCQPLLLKTKEGVGGGSKLGQRDS